MTLDVTLPINTRATVYLPAEAGTVRESGRPLDAVEGISLLRRENSAAVLAIGSGGYHFTSKVGH